MRPQKQLYRRGNAPDGQFGDCHRTCIAMILNMHRDRVPHFMDDCPPDLPPDDPRSVAAERAEVEWLARRGLSMVNIPFPGTDPLEVILEQFAKLAHGAPLVLGCSSGRGDHSVVICDGRVHNPNDGEVVGPMRDGMWWITIYSVGQNWRSPRWLDRLTGLLR